MWLRTLGSSTFHLQVTVFNPAHGGMKSSFHSKTVYWSVWNEFGGLDPVPSSTSQKPLPQLICISWLPLVESLSGRAKRWMALQSPFLSRPWSLCSKPGFPGMSVHGNSPGAVTAPQAGWIHTAALENSFLVLSKPPLFVLSTTRYFLFSKNLNSSHHLKFTLLMFSFY